MWGVDPRGWCRPKNRIALSYAVRPKAGCRSICMADDHHCLLFASPRTDRRETGIMTPHVSTWCHRTWPNLPGLPPPYLHPASDQMMSVGVAWEQGYNSDPRLHATDIWGHSLYGVHVCVGVQTKQTVQSLWQQGACFQEHSWFASHYHNTSVVRKPYIVHWENHIVMLRAWAQVTLDHPAYWTVQPPDNKGSGGVELNGSLCLCKGRTVFVKRKECIIVLKLWQSVGLVTCATPVYYSR